jgi:hypothetical protein
MKKLKNPIKVKGAEKTKKLIRTLNKRRKLFA